MTDAIPLIILHQIDRLNLLQGLFLSVIAPSAVVREIAPSLGDIAERGNILPAAGVGLRYRPFKDYDVQLRVDFGLGKNDHGVYVGIAEAF